MITKRVKNKQTKFLLHGYKILMPYDYTYPINSRIYSNYNNPLIECVYQVYKYKKCGLVLMDIGAAIGDTALLIKSNCRDMVSQFFCIEGDNEFFQYLQKNMDQFDDVKCIKTLLSDSDTPVNSLTRIHSGTASAQGDAKAEAITLDKLSCDIDLQKLDLIKIDTDGYDGKILTGAKNILIGLHPVVIFEWHPILCVQTNNDYSTVFNCLQECGYIEFIWFTKYGNFSHFTFEISDKYIEKFADICINAKFESDWHYDIVALPANHKFSISEFANAEYSRNKKSPY